MNETQLIVLVTYVAVIAGIAALVFGMRDLAAVLIKGSSRTVLRQTVLAETSASSSLLPRFDQWFAKLVYQSGLGMSLGTASLLLVLFGLAVGGAIYVLTEDLLSTSVAAGLGCCLCILGLLVIRRRRIKSFEQNLPTALDLLARATRSGQSLEQAVALVAKASNGPVAYEFNQCTKQLEMGLSISKCMSSLAKRMDMFDTKIFASTLAIHREMGGNLSQTLERLSDVIRERAEYRGHLKSVTGAGRFSIGVISILGPILFVYLFVIQPEYGQEMWADPIGKWMLIAAIILQVLGLLWVSRLLKAEY